MRQEYRPFWDVEYSLSKTKQKLAQHHLILGYHIISYITGQQFTAFKPLAHRPRPRPARL